MWQLQEDREAELAAKLGDKSFNKGETRRKYIHAQILKENVRGIYTGRMILERDGVGLTDVSSNARHATSNDFHMRMRDFSVALGKAEAQGVTLMPTGKRGVFENRAALRPPFNTMKRAKLQALVRHGLDEGILEVQPNEAGNSRLISTLDDGKFRKYRELVQRVVEVAFERGAPFSMDAKDPNGALARRDELPDTLSKLCDKDLEAAFRLALMHGEVNRSGQDSGCLGHMIPTTA